VGSADPWRKAPQELVDLFHEAVEGIEDLEVRKMFGFPAGFIAGNMTAGVHQDTIMLRLPDDERQARLDAGWSLFEPMPGRPMREYVALPAEVTADAGETRAWIERAAAYVRTLPPKEAKPGRRR
jgi:TfoX/Sxy family transcriptional regulator of competence genes